MYAPDPLQIYPLYSIIFCYQLVTDHFWDSGGGIYENYENHLFKNFIQTPAQLCILLFWWLYPNEMNQSTSFAIVRA